MYSLGIIPAAGDGERWGGYIKEMLPIDRHLLLIDTTTSAMHAKLVDAIVIVTNERKLITLAKHAIFTDTPVYFLIQQGNRDMWSAIIEACQFPADRYLFAMPDTIYPVNTFDRAPQEVDFALGIFETDRPERFGVLVNGRIENKNPHLIGPRQAWGNLVWSSRCVELWRNERPADYTEAINIAIDNYGLETWSIDYYHDMASFEDYQEWMRSELWK